MSNVMHSHHGTVTDANGKLLIPDMPPAIDDQGIRRDPALTRQVLEETCYLCHPGQAHPVHARRHGQRWHWSARTATARWPRSVTTSRVTSRPTIRGTSTLRPISTPTRTTPRVPWANEPGCGSCHTGYATDNLAGDGRYAGQSDAISRATPTASVCAGLPCGRSQGNADRAHQQALRRTGGAEEFNGTLNNGAGNPKLYRVSTGHGGVMCEGCHGATHAEWPNGNPNANDNVTANQLQGHTGTLIECTTCHVTSRAAVTTPRAGPHGMHLVQRPTLLEGRAQGPRQA